MMNLKKNNELMERVENEINNIITLSNAARMCGLTKISDDLQGISIVLYETFCDLQEEFDRNLTEDFMKGREEMGNMIVSMLEVCKENESK